MHDEKRRIVVAPIHASHTHTHTHIQTETQMHDFLLRF